MLFNNSGNSDPQNNLIPVCSLSEEWIEKFIREIIEKTNIIKKLSLKTNENIVIKNGRMYVDFIPGKMKETSISTIQNELNNFVLNYLTKKRSFYELYNVLRNNNIKINETILMDYLKSLIRRGFILTDLQLANFKCMDIENLYMLIREQK
ncbi:lantibiotic dehydratase, partial [Staphylococcus arlettae]|nr:lantibiotic dehydratase [Staphylococcus arlettae]